MKKTIYIFIFILVIAPVFGQEINWIVSYDKAIEMAGEQDRNIVVLITAPSWCSPCQYMEANVWPNEDIVGIVNENYIPLRIEDVVNGERNPLLNKFMFTGFPTTFVYNQQMEKLAEFVGAVNAEYLYERLMKYKDPDFDVTSTFGDFELENGWLRQKSISDWEFLENGKPAVSLIEVSRADGYAYLYNPSERYHLAIPLENQEQLIYVSTDNGKNWGVWAEF